MQNPYWIAYRNPRENSRKRYMFTGGITYKITDWMNVAGRIRVDNTNSLYTEKLYATSNPTLLENSKKGKYTETRGEERQTYGDVMLNLSKTFKEKFSLDAHIGASIKDNRFDELSVYGPIAGAPNIFNVVNLDKSQKKTPKTGWHEQTQSFFYSLELGWKSQLFVTTTGRNDWASQLANSPQKSFFYPSVGVSWLPSSTFNFPEKFNYLKIRASWASVANPFPRELTIATHPYDDPISVRLLRHLYSDRTRAQYGCRGKPGIRPPMEKLELELAVYFLLEQKQDHRTLQGVVQPDHRGNDHHEQTPDQ